MSGNHGTNDPEHEQSDVRPAESGQQATPDSDTASDTSVPTEQFTAVTRPAETDPGPSDDTARSGDAARSDEAGARDVQAGGEQGGSEQTGGRTGGDDPSAGTDPTRQVPPWDAPTTAIPVVSRPGTPSAQARSDDPAPEPGSEAMTDKIHRAPGQPPEPSTPPTPPATTAMPPASPPPGPPPPTGGPGPDPSGRPEAGRTDSGRSLSNRTAALIVGGIVAVLAVLYGADLALSSGKVPRGVTVAGIEIGGKPVDEAESVLRGQLGARLNAPVAVTAGDTSGEIVPARAGIDVDWDATLDRVGSQPLNPFTRIGSFFGNDEIGVVSTRDDAALTGAIEQVTAAAAYEPREGNIVFEEGTPVPVTPQPGQRVDVEGATGVFTERWPFGDVTLPVESVDVTVTREGLDRALAEIAVPAVSADITVRGNDGTVATLAREQIGAVLSFVPDGSGGLEPQYRPEAAIDILRPQLAATENEPQDAQIVLQGGGPTIVPSVKGELVDWEPTLASLPQLLAATGERSVDAVYRSAEPELTTEAAEKLGVREVIAEYTSGGFEYASGVNIRLAASEINGALVKPGETFSLNGYTGPRGAAQGYVESGIIEAGRPGKAVGGGISQLATTLYNASYFAGMEDVEHTEHSYYISRYPAAREATVYEGAIDLKFRNPFETGVLIQAVGTSSDITVRMWGTKTVDVQSITGDRTNFTSPNTITLPAGPGCIPSSGAQGFTTSDTRIVTDARTGAQISNTTRTVRYDPVPIVKCVSPEPAPRNNEPAEDRAPAEEPATPPAPGDSDPGAAAPEGEDPAPAEPGATEE